MLVTLAAAGAAAGLPVPRVPRRAGALDRQNRQLLEATRRDPLTGLLNHGAIVAELADAAERARADDAAIGVALVDLDNFRLLNDTHGHAAADGTAHAWRRVLERHRPGDAVVGRYGPDEFLVIAPRGDEIVRLEPAMDGCANRWSTSESPVRRVRAIAGHRERRDRDLP